MDDASLMKVLHPTCYVKEAAVDAKQHSHTLPLALIQVLPSTLGDITPAHVQAVKQTGFNHLVQRSCTELLDEEELQVITGFAQ